MTREEEMYGVFYKQDSIIKDITLDKWDVIDYCKRLNSHYVLRGGDYEAIPVKIIKLSEEDKALEREQKTGYWIEHYGYDFKGDYAKEYSCSECNEYVNDKSKYCPNCGADMRDKEDEE